MKASMFGKFRSPRYLMMILGCVTFLFMQVAPNLLAADQSGEQTADQEKRLEIMKAKGTEASLTVMPILLGKTPLRKVAMVVGTLLERAGMKNLEIDSVEFQPEPDADFNQMVTAFGEFISRHPVKTDYILYGEFRGTQKTGILEIRGLVVNQKGDVVWQDRQTPEDEAFQKAQPKNPMLGSVFLVERLRAQLNLDDPLREDASEGKISKIFKQESGIPPKSTYKAMEKRVKEIKRTNSLLIFPALIVKDKIDPQCAEKLVEQINKTGLCKAIKAEQSPVLEFESDMNEQKVLWSLARSFRNYIRQNKPDVEYALYPHYMYFEAHSKVSAVHFIICDQNGAWVIVDFQNNHQPDFQNINPRTLDGCDRLVIKRLENYLSK